MSQKRLQTGSQARLHYGAESAFSGILRRVAAKLPANERVARPPNKLDSKFTKSQHSGFRKLTDEQVIEARRRYAERGTLKATAEEFGVRTEVLEKAVYGESYQYLPNAQVPRRAR